MDCESWSRSFAGDYHSWHFYSICMHRGNALVEVNSALQVARCDSGVYCLVRALLYELASLVKFYGNTNNSVL